MNLIYPLLVHRYNIDIRDTSLGSDSSFLNLFLYHYAVAGMLILLLFILLRYANRTFSGNKLFIKSYWVYFSLFLLFMLYAEYDHIIVMISYGKGKGIQGIMIRNREIILSFLFMLSAMVILLTGLVRKTRFLRIYSLILIVVILAKIIVVDIPTMGTRTKTFVFLYSGSCC